MSVFSQGSCGFWITLLYFCYDFSREINYYVFFVCFWFLKGSVGPTAAVNESHGVSVHTRARRVPALSFLKSKLPRKLAGGRGEWGVLQDQFQTLYLTLTKTTAQSTYILESLPLNHTLTLTWMQ